MMAARVDILDAPSNASRPIAQVITSVDEINDAIQKASISGRLNGILEYNTDPLVSIDFNHNPASSCFDATQTSVRGRWVKVMAWYDNEWGFSNRMLDNTIALMQAGNNILDVA